MTEKDISTTDRDVSVTENDTAASECGTFTTGGADVRVVSDTCLVQWTFGKRCGNPVPPGELPHLSYNGSGGWIMACQDCRERIDALFAGIHVARVKQGVLRTAVLPLKDNLLISDSEMRNILVNRLGIEPAARGPLSDEHKVKAVGWKFGKTMAMWLHTMLGRPST